MFVSHRDLIFLHFLRWLMNYLLFMIHLHIILYLLWPVILDWTTWECFCSENKKHVLWHKNSRHEKRYHQKACIYVRLISFVQRKKDCSYPLFKLNSSVLKKGKKLWKKLKTFISTHSPTCWVQDSLVSVSTALKNFVENSKNLLIWLKKKKKLQKTVKTWFRTLLRPLFCIFLHTLSLLMFSSKFEIQPCFETWKKKMSSSLQCTLCLLLFSYKG